MRFVNRQRGWLFACTLILAGRSLGKTTSDQLQSLFREGAEQMHAGNAAAAGVAFHKAPELDPSFAPAHLDLGLAQLKEGKLPEAIASIRKSLELDPHSSGVHLFLGIAEYESNDPDSALADLHLSLKEDPKNVQALTWVGIVELNVGHPELAVKPLDRAAELSPKDENVLDYQVQAHMAAAKQSYTALYKLDSTSWPLHRLNAAIDAQADDHKGAIAEYQLAIKLAPKEAAEQLKLTPGNPIIAMYNLVGAQVDSGQEQAALPLLQQVVKIYNHPTGADYYLGRALAAEGKEIEAVLAFQRATTLNGEMQRRAWYQLSQSSRHLGKTAEARAAALKYEQLKQAADAASAKEVEDWRKLNATNAAASGDTRQQ